ncbi:MAG: DUF6044 family protein [Humidesulfovibrio sp.]|nr:DUF6044 family protein [Humidesulfovibrio sp.]
MKFTPASPSATNNRQAIIFFALLCAAIYFDRLLLGPYAVTIFPDALDDMMHFPARAFLLLHQGFTAWDPLVPGGAPNMASQFPSYSLPVLASTIVPLWLISHAWNMLIFFAFSYGTYRVAHNYFHTSRRSALLASTLSMAPFLDSNPQILFAFVFPLFFSWTHDVCDDTLPLQRRIPLVFGLLCIIATSYPVLTLPIYPIFHFFFYCAFFRNRPNFKRNICAIFLVWTGYVLFYAPTITSLLQYVPFSDRTFSVQSTNFALATASCLSELHSALRVDNALVVIGLSLFFAFHDSTVRRTLSFALGLILLAAIFRSDFRLMLADTALTKMDLRLAATTSIFPLVLCLGFVIDRLRKGLRQVPWPWWLFLIAASVLLLKNEARIIRSLLVLAEITLGAQLLQQTSAPQSTAETKLKVAALCACLALSLMLGRQNALSFGQARIAQVVDNHPALSALRHEDSAPYRVGSLDLHPSIAISYGLETVDGRGPLFNRHFKENMRLAISPQLKTPAMARLFDSFWYALTLTPNPTENYPRYDQTFGIAPHTASDLNIPALQSLNVRYLLAGHPVAGLEGIATLVAEDNGKGLPGPLHATRLNRYYELPIYIYRLNETMERGHIVSRILSCPDREQALHVLEGLDLNTRRTTAVMLDADRKGLPELSGNGGGTAALRTYSPDRLVYDCDVSGPSCLVVANNFDPGWRATVDGASVKVFRADNAFQSVFLPGPGNHRVELTFRPPLLPVSDAAALVGLLLICSLVLLGRGGKLTAPAQSPIAPAMAREKRGQWQAGLAGGGIAAVLWVAGYQLFMLPRFPYPHEPAHYALVAIPVAGILVALVLSQTLFKR